MRIKLWKNVKEIIWPVGKQDETGDVPGWVMITLMTAALVVLLWAVAGPALTDLFNNAINRVLGI